MPAALERDYDVLSGIDRSMPDIVAEWVTASRAAIAAAPAPTTIAYGSAPGLSYDVYLPEGPARGTVLFLHGGFWVQGSKDVVAFPLRAFTGAGIAYVAVTYGLAPAFSLAAMIENAEAAVLSLAARAPGLGIDPDRLALVGHSAGAYLAAALLGRARRAPSPIGSLLISGLYDLSPVSRLAKVEALGLSGDDCRRLSIAGRELAGARQLVLAVGEREPAGFKAQTFSLARRLEEAGAAARLLSLPGDDHFSIARALARAEAPLTETVLGFFD